MTTAKTGRYPTMKNKPFMLQPPCDAAAGRHHPAEPAQLASTTLTMREIGA